MGWVRKCAEVVALEIVGSWDCILEQNGCSAILTREIYIVNSRYAFGCRPYLTTITPSAVEMERWNVGGEGVGWNIERRYLESTLEASSSPLTIQGYLWVIFEVAALLEFSIS